MCDLLSLHNRLISNGAFQNPHCRSGYESILFLDAIPSLPPLASLSVSSPLLPVFLPPPKMLNVSTFKLYILKSDGCSSFYLKLLQFLGHLPLDLLQPEDVGLRVGERGVEHVNVSSVLLKMDR